MLKCKSCFKSRYSLVDFRSYFLFSANANKSKLSNVSFKIIQYSNSFFLLIHSFKYTHNCLPSKLGRVFQPSLIGTPLVEEEPDPFHSSPLHFRQPEAASLRRVRRRRKPFRHPGQCLQGHEQPRRADTGHTQARKPGRRLNKPILTFINPRHSFT